MRKEIAYWLKMRDLMNQVHYMVSEAQQLAEEISPPRNYRKATANDMTVGNIIWYHLGNPDTEYNQYWRMIDEVKNPYSDWKAYTAHDGCRYGLNDAFVEIEE